MNEIFTRREHTSTDRLGATARKGRSDQSTARGVRTSRVTAGATATCRDVSGRGGRDALLSRCCTLRPRAAGRCYPRVLARTVALEGFLVLEHVASVDEALLLGGHVGPVAPREHRLEVAHGDAELHLQRDLAPLRRLDVHRHRPHPSVYPVAVHTARPVPFPVKAPPPTLSFQPLKSGGRSECSRFTPWPGAVPRSVEGWPRGWNGAVGVGRTMCRRCVRCGTSTPRDHHPTGQSQQQDTRSARQSQGYLTGARGGKQRLAARSGFVSLNGLAPFFSSIK